MDQHHEIHWIKESKRILNFVQGTRTHGIFYKAKFDIELVGFTDSDWTGDNIDQNYTLGYLFMLADGPINQSSKKQSVIALSSTQEDYTGAMNETTQCLWLQGILGEFGIETENYTVIYCDNQRSIQISTNPVQRQIPKHIEIHMHYIRELVHDGTIALLYCAYSEQVANISTKVFCENTFSNIK